MAEGKNGAKGAGGITAAVRKQQEIAEALRRKIEAEKKKKGGK